MKLSELINTIVSTIIISSIVYGWLSYFGYSYYSLIGYFLTHSIAVDITEIKDKKQKFFKVIHNLIAHPLLLTNFKWSETFHDWTASKM